MTKPFILGSPRHTDSAFCSTGDLYRIVGHNCGNLAFTHAIDAHLGGNLPSGRWSDASQLIGQGGDLAVLPAANQLGKHFAGNAMPRFRKMSVPVVVIGLGAQSNVQWTIPNIPANTISWICGLAARAPGKGPNIGVRGPFSMQVLRKIGLDCHAEIIGCPSLFLNPAPALGADIVRRLRTPRRVAVVAGHQHWRHLRHIEASLGRLVAQTNGSYIGQASFDMMKLTRGEAKSMDETSLRQCRDYVCPDMSLPDFVDWSVRYGNIFFNVQNWIEHLARYDFVIGTRIHGTILGLQAGVPSVCIAHDSRTLELCQTMKIPYVLAADVPDGIAYDHLVSYFNFDPCEFDRNRRALCRTYVEFLKNNRLNPADWLVNIANGVDERADVAT